VQLVKIGVPANKNTAYALLLISLLFLPGKYTSSASNWQENNGKS